MVEIQARVELARQVVAAELQQPLADPAAQLAGGALGVGDHEDRVDVDAALADCAAEALDDHGRLAGAGARRDEDDAPLLDRPQLLVGDVSTTVTRPRIARSGQRRSAEPHARTCSRPLHPAHRPELAPGRARAAASGRAARRPRGCAATTPRACSCARLDPAPELLLVHVVVLR